jgi:hypothetical protein
MRTPDFSPLVSRLTSLLILAAPAAVLGIAYSRTGSELLAVGAGAAALGALLFARHREVWRPPASGSVVILYLISLGWVWFATHEAPDWYARAARGFLLVGAVFLVIGHDLARTGLEPRRRAEKLCRALAGRARWPQQVAGYADLPEVRALQDAVRDDPGPALKLLADPRAEVRTAAFVALSGRKYWRLGESAAVLDAVRMTVEPKVRSAGVLALSGANDPDTVLALGELLRDPTPDVRHTAAVALLAAGGRRWPVARDMVRAALADPTLANDGALPGGPGRLPAMAVCDLTAWAAEPEPLAGRSVRTLVEHLAAEVRGGDSPGLPAELGRQVLDAQTPPALRLELAALLRGLGLVTPDLLDRMTDADQPGPIRLLAAETMLSQNPAHPVAIDVLRGLGRQSHRETALAIARLLQTYLGLDMELPEGPVAANSKVATEAAKRVLQWATGRAEKAPAEGQTRVGAPPRPPSLPAQRPQSQATTQPQARPPAGRGSSANVWVPN